MKLCAKCGSQLGADQMVCDRCGTSVFTGQTPLEAAPPDEGGSPDDANSKKPRRRTSGSVCGSCGAFLPDGCRSCLVCGTERGALPSPEGFPLPLAEPENQEPIPPPNLKAREAPLLWTRWVKGLSAALCAMLVVIGALGIWQRFFDTSGYRADESVVYESAEGVLMMSYPGLEQPLELGGVKPSSGYADGTVVTDPEGRRLVYLSGGGGLYALDFRSHAVSRDSGRFQAVTILEEGVREARFVRDGGSLVYLTQDQQLWVTDFSEKRMLSQGVKKLLDVGGTTVLFLQTGEMPESDTDLFLIDLTREGSGMLIDWGVQEALDWTPDFEKILYTRVRNDGDSEQRTVYLNSFDMKQGTVDTLAVNVGKVVDAAAETGSVVYLTPQAVEFSYNAFVDDDLMELDKDLTEPALADYPLLEQAYAIYGVGSDLQDVSQNEELVEQQLEYETKLREYEDKADRDLLRERLQSVLEGSPRTETLYDLYSYYNGELRLLDSGVRPLAEKAPHEAVSAGQDYLIYEKLDINSMTRVKLSEMWETPELRISNPGRYLHENAQRELVFSTLAGRRSRIYVSSEQLAPDQWMVAPDRSGIYFSLAPLAGGGASGRYETYYAPIKNDAIGDAVLVMQKQGALSAGFNGGALFQDKQDQTLYLLRQGSADEIGAPGSAKLSIRQANSCLVYYSGYSQDTQSGELRMFSREMRVVSPSVREYLFQSESLIYVLRDNGELWQWRSGALTKLAENVKKIAGESPET